MTLIRVNLTGSSSFGNIPSPDVNGWHWNNSAVDFGAGTFVTNAVDSDGNVTDLQFSRAVAYGNDSRVSSRASGYIFDLHPEWWNGAYTISGTPVQEEVSGTLLTPGKVCTVYFSGFSGGTDPIIRDIEGSSDTSAVYENDTGNDNPNPLQSFQATVDGAGKLLLDFANAAGATFSYVNGYIIDIPDVVGPSLDTPTSVTGDNPTLAFTGVQLSTTKLDVQAEWSLQSDFSVIGGVVSFPLNAPSDGSTFTADFKNGFEEALGNTASGFDYVPFTDGAYFCRWVFKDDTESDIYLEFDSLDGAGYSHYEFDSSEATTDADSLLADYVPYLPSSQPCQMAMPNSVTNELGGTVTFDFADPDHPLPNQYGGDTEELQATYIATAVTTTAGNKVWSQEVPVTPFSPPPSEAPTADATDVTVDTTAYTADQT